MADLLLEANAPVSEPEFGIKGARLLALEPVARMLVQPFAVDESKTNSALSTQGFPALSAVGKITENDAGRVVWAGHRQWFLEGNGVENLRLETASVTDQSDHWAVFELIGESSVSILARLCPLDLSQYSFPLDSCARSEVAHVMCCIIAIENGFQLMVMRSFAQDFQHHVKGAMQRVAAQDGLEK